jgi:hypothetical protein
VLEETGCVAYRLQGTASFSFGVHGECIATNSLDWTVVVCWFSTTECSAFSVFELLLEKDSSVDTGHEACHSIDCYL